MFMAVSVVGEVSVAALVVGAEVGVGLAPTVVELCGGVDQGEADCLVEEDVECEGGV